MPDDVRLTYIGGPTLLCSSADSGCSRTRPSTRPARSFVRPEIDRAFAAAGLGHRLRWLPRGVEAAAPS